MDNGFWRGRRVFVTGHTGFKGAWLTLWLERLGAVVEGYALPPERDGALHTLLWPDDDGRGTGDVRDAETLARRLAAFRPEIVLHLAAQALVRHSYAEPVATMQTNVTGTINLLEAIRGVDSVTAALVVTSDKCYRNREWHWGYREDEPLGGHDPYSASKACTELVTDAWRSSFLSAAAGARNPVALATARAGNVIGGGDLAVDRLVPDALRELAAGRSVEVRRPDAVRPWQHVLEPLAGYLSLARHLALDGERFAGAWNFGPSEDSARPVGWIVSRLCESWSGGGTWHRDGGAHPHEAGHLKLDSAKAREELGWRPVWTLADTLDEIVDWQRAHLAGHDMRVRSLATIERFERDAARMGVEAEAVA